MMNRLLGFLVAAGCVACVAGTGPGGARSGPGEASIDLTTSEGLAQVGGTWRYLEAGITEVEGRTKDGRSVKTHEIFPHAGGVDFDDSKWEALSPRDIHHAIGGGKLSFAWFRINIRVPERVGEVSTADAAVVLEVTIDDYAEVWVEGKLPRKLGQSGGSMVKGFNCPNRVLLAEHARPGEVFHVAVFGANGPLSDPPGNWVWLRSASLRICRDVGGGCKPD
ncbi:MAG TPA: hypothetical protein VHC70_15915 [Phycisphaerales bacterium]|nr:hypothetical protein [Phycisphaerales bacterium]